MSARLTAGVRHALLAAAVLAVPAWSQTPADLNLFGPPPEKKPPPEPQGNPVLGFLVQALGGPGPRKPQVAPENKTLHLPHALTFQDGRELRGELVSLIQGEIVWKRADASEPLKFTRSEVRRIALNDDPSLLNAPQMVEAPGIPGLDLPGATKVGTKPTAATVKLPGGDWLYADVTSTDGETLQLSLGGESKFTAPRSAVEWLHFGLSPAPAATLSSGSMALEGWVRQIPKGTVEEKNGWMTVTGVDWIGRNVSPPSRFEIAFDLKADDKQNTTLWIQPFGPQPNCYGRGTVELRLSPTEISRCIYINNIAHEKSPMPKDVAPDNTASFRVLYDGVEEKLVVLRNGKLVGDWKLKDEKEAQVNRGWEQRGVNGICLHRQGGPVLGKFRIQPWDGTVPKEGEAAATEDRLSIGKDAPLVGKLEAITATELVFSGAKKSRGAGTFLQLSSRPKAMKGADAQLFFGHRGELGAADLEVRDGRVSFRSSFAERIEAPLKALPMISFTAAEAKPARSGALVFKNGDELPGTLLSAETGGVLKWKTATGQEIEFQVARVAGVRFPIDTKETPGSILELRNGDRLRGELSDLNEKQLQLTHPLLGKLGIDRERLRTLYPNPKTVIFDTSSDPEAWTENGCLVNLDGKYALRGIAQNYFYSNEGRGGISRELKGMPDRFELRCEAVDFSGNEPNLGIGMTSLGTGSQSSLNLDLNYGSLRIHGWVSSGRSRSFWRDVALRNRNGRYEPEPRSSVRLFIDNKVGTVDVYVNGIHRARTGQNANERSPGIAGRVTIGGYGNSNIPVVISDIWVGPWNGELPRPDAPATVALSNGDVAEALPKELRNGKLVVDPGGGDLELPMEKVDCVTFGGAMEPVGAPGRIRLAGGDAVSVESFQFAGGELTAKSKTLGDIRVPAKSVRELVFDAAPATFPMIIDPKKKPAPEDGAKPAAAIENIR